jgi:hypothetical protein
MPDENPFTLRQVDLARADFAAIEDHLDFIKAQLGECRRGGRSRASRSGSCSARAGLVIGWFEVFWRHCL